MRLVLRKRRAAAAAAAPCAADDLRDVFLRAVSLPEKTTIAAYLAQGTEMNPARLVETLRARGHRICLPCTPARGQPLAFRLYGPNDALCKGPNGIPEPLPEAKDVAPDVLLIPLLGFDNKGNRLGQGGGFYDRTLAWGRARGKIVAIGIAYAAQEVEAVPVSAYDERLELIVTEKGVIDPFS